MIRTFSLLLTLAAALLLAAPATAQKKSAGPKSYTIPAGTIVVFETTTPLSSKDAQVGQSVTLRVKYDVVIKGKTLIKGGATGSAQVTTAEAGKGMGKQGSLGLRPSVVQAVDGQMVPLAGNGASAAGEGKTGTSVALAVVVSPLFLLKKGKDATIPAGYEIQGTVANATDIEL